MSWSSNRNIVENEMKQYWNGCIYCQSKFIIDNFGMPGSAPFRNPKNNTAGMKPQWNTTLVTFKTIAILCFVLGFKAIFVISFYTPAIPRAKRPVQRSSIPTYYIWYGHKSWKMNGHELAIDCAPLSRSVFSHFLPIRCWLKISFAPWKRSWILLQLFRAVSNIPVVYGRVLTGSAVMWK